LKPVPDALARHRLSGSGGHCLAVVFVSHSLSGIWAAVQAGLGITLRTRVGCQVIFA
jgi:DNA-binding transcriptional LysR family regulator